MSPEGIDPQEVVYGDTYKPRRTKQDKLSELGRVLTGESFEVEVEKVLHQLTASNWANLEANTRIIYKRKARTAITQLIAQERSNAVREELERLRPKLQHNAEDLYFRAIEENNKEYEVRAVPIGFVTGIINDRLKELEATP